MGQRSSPETLFPYDKITTQNPLENKADPASSYATDGIALRIPWPHKPQHNINGGMSSEGPCFGYKD